MMDEPVAIPAAETEAQPAEGKKKKKEEKSDISFDKIELSLYRAQLSMVRTAVTTTSLGFALYKLLDEKLHDGSDRPVLHVISPRMVALVLFFAGFLGLSSYCFRHVAALKKINRFTPKFYYSGIMLVSYVILLLTLTLFWGTLLNP